MTTLEIILIAIIWISYGVFTVHIESRGEFGDYVFFITFAPLILALKIIVGPFKRV